MKSNQIQPKRVALATKYFKKILFSWRVILTCQPFLDCRWVCFCVYGTQIVHNRIGSKEPKRFCLTTVVCCVRLCSSQTLKILARHQVTWPHAGEYILAYFQTRTYDIRQSCGSGSEWILIIGLDPDPQLKQIFLDLDENYAVPIRSSHGRSTWPVP